MDRAISVFSDDPSPAEDSILSALKDTISDLTDVSCSKKARQKVPMNTPANQKAGSTAKATAEESAKRRDRDRLKPFHNMLHWMCDERKEDYGEVLKGLANKRDMPQAEVYDLVQSGKGGRVWAMVQEQLMKARKALTAENFQETAQLLEELCIPDSAYHRLRTVCGLQNELPTLYKIKKNRAELNMRIATKLNVKQLKGGGWLVDYAKLWDWVKELITDGVFPDAELPDGKLMGILTFDGRSIGGRSQIYVGLKFPWLNFGKVQSCDSIFPVAILPGSDGVGNTAKTFNDVPIGGGKSLTALIKQVRDSGEQTIKHNGQERKIKYQQCFAADQKSMWSLYDICQLPMTKKNPTAQICTYCDCCNASDIKGDFGLESDPRSDGSYLFDPASECTFCLLHCKLRITERLLFLAAKKAHATKKMGKLQKAIRKLGIDMTIQNVKGTLTVTSMNGPDCEKLMAGRSEWLKALKVPAQPKQMDDNTEEMEDALWREVWDLWVQLFSGLNGRYGVEGPNAEQVEGLRKKIDRFGAIWHSLYANKHVTTYIHILMRHAVDHLIKFKELWRYANEGFEAANKKHRFWFARCTQRGGVCGGSNQYGKRKGKRSCSMGRLYLKT